MTFAHGDEADPPAPDEAPRWDQAAQARGLTFSDRVRQPIERELESHQGADTFMHVVRTGSPGVQAMYFDDLKQNSVAYSKFVLNSSAELGQRQMELTFYDMGGRPIAYCDNERHIYSFGGVPLAYLDGDSLWAFDGRHLGWWHHGWVLDHFGAAVFFTERANGTGPRRPSTQGRPAKGLKNMVPRASIRHVKPIPFLDGNRWSPHSGTKFFPSSF